jgi:FkbM family methyltransferase
VSTTANFRNFLRDTIVPVMLQKIGVAPAPTTRFLSGQRQISIKALGVENVLDVGANVGQFAREIRLSGFGGNIFYFEPGSSPFESLAQAAAADSRWSVYKTGMSDHLGDAVLHTWAGAGSAASSLRPPVSGVIDMLGAAMDERVGISTISSWLEENPSVAPTAN